MPSKQLQRDYGSAAIAEHGQRIVVQLCVQCQKEGRKSGSLYCSRDCATDDFFHLFVIGLPLGGAR